MELSSGVLKRALKDLSLNLFIPQDDLINWDLASSIAFDISKGLSTNKNEPDDPDQSQNDYALIRDESIAKVEQIVGQKIAYDLPLLVLDREEWIISTTDNMKLVFTDILEIAEELQKSAPDTLNKRISRRSTGSLLTAEIGVVVGFLSQKVLAQFDWAFAIPSMPEKRFIYFLEPNIEKALSYNGLDGAIFKRWIAAHEVTHAYQFYNHPWLEEKMRSFISGLKDLLIGELASQTKPQLKTLSSLGSLINLSKPLGEMIKDMQAFMSFVEGYADVVMRKVGKDLPEADRYVPFFLKKERKKDLMDEIMGKVLGFNMKMQQYKAGAHFIEQVEKKRGFEFISHAWEGPGRIPTHIEYTDPDSWINRMETDPMPSR